MAMVSISNGWARLALSPGISHRVDILRQNASPLRSAFIMKKQIVRKTRLYESPPLKRGCMGS